MSDVEESAAATATEAAPKRGRGRPKGSLNKKTLERRAAEAAAATPLVAAEAAEAAAPEATPEAAPELEPEVVPEPVEEVVAPSAAHDGSAAKPKRQAKRTPEPVEEAPPKPKRKRPPPAPRPPDALPGPLLHEASLLDIMKAGLAHARAKHKADKVAKYDAMFAY